MQLHQILLLAAAALMGCAVTTTAALDFNDAASSASSSTGVSVNQEDRIYGGEEADAEKYPFTVSLRKTADGNTYCGGALVAAQYVVTAAHCVKNVTYASIGSRYSNGDKEGERLLVTEVFVHPKYVKDTHVFDVAVMKLEKPSTYKTLPLCKADGSQNKENSMAVVRGWGMTETNVAATTLLEVNVKIISNAICNKSYNNRITPEMLCAGQGGGKDSCQGDSGGPLITNNVLVGVVSWGGACGEAPGVYTRATSVLDFIQEKIGGATTPATTTPAPATTTPAPATTTPAPATTTPAPATTTPAPETTTPATTTPAPATTTPAPEATTATPVTQAPVTEAPVTEAPAATTSAPEATTATPTVTTEAPAATTATPSLTPATPSTTSPAATPAPTAAGDSSTLPGKDPTQKKCGVRL